MRSETNKWLSYYDLRDACKEEGCPVCLLLDRVGRRYLDDLFYERVNDVGTRERIHASSGFCNWHAWQATQIPDSQTGISIIYETLLRMFERRLLQITLALTKRKQSKGWLRRLMRRGRTKSGLPKAVELVTPCPVCQQVAFFEEVYLLQLLDFFTDEEFSEAYRQSSGLCLPHLDITVEKFPGHKNLPLLVRDETKRIDALRTELSEYIRKGDYQFRDEPLGSERTAWRRAIELASGKREVFSNHLRPLQGAPRGTAALSETSSGQSLSEVI